MKKIFHTSYISILVNLKFGGFGMGYGIVRKYWPLWVLVSVLNLNQSSGFGRSLGKMLSLNHHYYKMTKSCVMIGREM
jgi:hypothetical protein